MTQATGSGAQRGLRTGPSLWLAVPALAFFIFFAVIPLIGVVVLSFMTWDGLGSPEFTGGDKWVQVLSDPIFLNGFFLTLQMTAANWLIQTPLCILLGTFMAGRQRYRAVLAVFYFLPLLFSAVAVGIAFKSLLDPNFGMGAALGIPWLNQDWLGQPALAMPALYMVIAWCFVPFHSLLYQGAVRQIPTSILEAAKIDGAGRMQTFFGIIIPQLRNTIITSSTLIIVGSFTYFDLIYVMTQGGPGIATRVMPLDMYLRGFKSFDMGAAAVVGVIIAVLGLGVSYFLNRLGGTNRMDSQLEGA